MSGRRDSKNRKLNKGEYQRSDGRYAYRYVDQNGNERWVYSWRLTATDKVPEGKEATACLRDLEIEIVKALTNGIDMFEANRRSLNQCFESYMDLKSDLKERTRIQYRKLWKRHVADSLGKLCVSDIRYSDILCLFVHLIEHDGLSVGTVKDIYILLHPVLTIAVRDGLIRANPSDGTLKAVLKNRAKEETKKRALTIEQQEAFVRFLGSRQKYARWRRLVIFLLGTGCRIGEASGLTWDDCDFENGIISVNQQVGYFRGEDDTKYRNHVMTPKSTSGKRIIPMFDAVRDILLEEKRLQEAVKTNTYSVDGKSGFVFHSRSGRCLEDGSISSALKNIARRYNEEEEKLAIEEGRLPLFLPEFTTHDLRHTFCTRLCENESNLKVIQEVMGHADISTTMNIYSEATKEAKIKSFKSLEGKIV